MAKKTKSSDINVTAHEILQVLTGEPSGSTSVQRDHAKKKAVPPAKNPAAVALGRLGGLKGGKARAKKLSSKEKSAIAKNAAKVRWSK
ncbi:MAG: hypothetical protein AABY96_01135 [Nitrospirota bacterium]